MIKEFLHFIKPAKFYFAGEEISFKISFLYEVEETDVVSDDAEIRLCIRKRNLEYICGENNTPLPVEYEINHEHKYIKVTIDENKSSLLEEAEYFFDVRLKINGSKQIFRSELFHLENSSFSTDVKTSVIEYSDLLDAFKSGIISDLEEFKEDYSGYSKSEIDDFLDLKANKSDLPDFDNYATKNYVDSQINNIPEIDLSNYYNKEEIDSLTAVDDSLSSSSTNPVQNRAVTTALNNKSNVGHVHSYNNLLDKPEIPAAQIQSDWDQTDTSAKDFIKNKPTIPSLDGYATEDSVDSKLEQKADTDSVYTKEQVDTKLLEVSTGISSDILDTYVQKSELQETLNDYVENNTYTSEIGNIWSEIDNRVSESDFDTTINGINQDLGDKEDASNKVTAINASSTDAQYPSAKCVYDAISSIPDEDSRLTEDMISYLNSKLAYTYNYSCNITSSDSSIDLPSEKTSVSFTATFSASKVNDMSSTNLTVSSVSNVTSGWTKGSSDNVYTKSVDVDPTATAVTSGAVTGTVNVSPESKSGSATGTSKSVTLTKPWFVFESDSDSIANTVTTIENLIDGTSSNLKSDRKAVNLSNTDVTITKTYLWFAIPNTRTMGSVDQISGLSSLESSTPKYTPTTSLGQYKIYRWGSGLAAGKLVFNLRIN